MERSDSQALFTRAAEVMPGGVSSPVRAFKSVRGTPVFFERGKGSRVWDADGNEYVDLCMSWGPLILGHARSEVLAAVHAAVDRGLTFGACIRQEAELAEIIVDAVQAVDRVRFVSSGTEAVMTAIRLARAATGRDLVLKFEGGYHGHSDSLLVKAGSGLATFGTSSSAGVPEAFASKTLVCPFDDEDALRSLLREHGSDLAAVVLEPLPANNGLLEQRAEWLHLVRRLCDQAGALLILDEVITGFRLGFGSYGERLGLRPDLITFGKIVGGGMPLGAVAGPKETMDLLAPEGPVYQAGTLSGNPISLAAGIATMEILRDEPVYDRLEDLGRHLDHAIEALGRDDVRLRRVGSLVWLYLDREDPPRRADRISRAAVERFNGLYHGLLGRGLYLPPSAYEVMFLSSAHDEDDLDRLVRGIEAGLAGA